MREDNEDLLEEQAEDLVEEQEPIEEEEKMSESENKKRMGGITASYKDLKFRVSKYPEM